MFSAAADLLGTAAPLVSTLTLLPTFVLPSPPCSRAQLPLCGARLLL